MGFQVKGKKGKGNRRKKINKGTDGKGGFTINMREREEHKLGEGRGEG